MTFPLGDTPEGPCRKLPYEILSKIFVYCLPLYPLTELQPNTKIAPMLLCHVCSSWRAVALTCTPLWSHLYFLLHILWDPQDGHPIVWDSKALMDDMEFLRWWKKKQGSMPPFIHFGIRQKYGWQRSENTYQDLRLDSDTEEFLLDYISSAQYLDVDSFYRYLTAHSQVVRSGSNPAYPNLHTLIIEHSLHLAYCHSTSAQDDEAYPDLAHNLPSVPLRIPPTLRRLCLFNKEYEREWIKNLSNWSTLTHLSLNIACNLSDWFSLIGAVPSLQWCHLYIYLLDQDIENYIQPTKIILHRLSHLFMFSGSAWNEPLDFPLCALFQNLEFPALEDLHLSSEGNTWWHSRAAIEVHASLSHTPMLTKLTLGSDGLAFWDGPFIPPATTGKDVVLLSSYVPLLIHLRLQLVCPNTTRAEAMVERFVAEMFLSKQWLDLESPTNTIRKVTIVVIEQFNNPLVETVFKDLLMSTIVKNANKATNVAFEITSQPNLRAITLRDETLKTWGTDLMT